MFVCVCILNFWTDQTLWKKNMKIRKFKLLEYIICKEYLLKPSIRGLHLGCSAECFLIPLLIDSIADGVVVVVVVFTTQ